MREILFRGKRIDNGEWVYGSYAFEPRRKGAFGQTISELDRERHYIVSKKNYEFWEVVPKTVGQYTGLTDENGKKIFEGDIVAEDYDWTGLVEFFTEDIGSCGCCVPEFDGSGFKAKYKNSDSGVDMRSCTIVGNIFDNPEMWEEEE